MNKLTRVSIRETYDLSTMKERMGIVAVKTPKMELIAKQWGGLLQNHKHVKLVGCNIKMACASMLPADPLQVGTESGEIAPQDMFNPILYRTVTNDSFGTILNRIYGLSNYGGEENSLVYDADALPNQIPAGNTESWVQDAWKIYYSLLADEHGWAKAMPQAGLRMDKIVPLVHEVASTIGSVPGYTVTWGKDGETISTRVENDYTVRGPARALPPIPTLKIVGRNILEGGETENLGKSAMVPEDIPAIFCAMIVLPPAKLNILYYRIIVEWVIDLIGLRSLNEIKSLAQLRDDGNSWYHTNYAFNNAKTTAVKMGSKEVSALELINAEGTKVM